MLHRLPPTTSTATSVDHKFMYDIVERGGWWYDDTSQELP
jgi:hypothetical protein